MTTSEMTQQNEMEERPPLIIFPKGATEVIVRGGDALPRWREAHRVNVPGAKYTPQFKARRWDGTYQPGKWCKPAGGGLWDMQCSRGLLPLLGESFQVPVLPTTWRAEEQRQAEALLRPEALEGRTLRDYQQEAIRKGLREGWGRIALATNAGKGAVIGLLARVLLQVRGLRTLVLCDEIAVFQALVEEIESWAGIEPARLESGAKEIPDAPVVVAMVPTLARRLKDDPATWRRWIRSFGSVLLDEADKATAATWRRILGEAKSSEWRLGFSGTFPTDAHGRLVMDELMGPVLVQKKNIELVERGISARPLASLYGYDGAPALRATPIPAKEWWDMPAPERRLSVFERAIVYNEDRHRFIADLVQEGAPTCIIVNRIDHGSELEREIPGSVFLDGSSSKTERDEALDRFKSGEVQVLIVTRIFDRGTNRLGHASDLIFASGEGSTRQTLQRIGRGLRRGGGKRFLRLVDVIDRGHKYLETAARKRVELYAAEQFEVEIKL